MKKNGISLIVLVITIIVMIILAASVVITLSNTGIIDRADQAVNMTNEKQMQDIASIAWGEAYLEGKRGTDLILAVESKLSEADKSYKLKYDITITDTGVSVLLKSENWENLFENGYTVNGIVTVSETGYIFNGANKYRLTIKGGEYTGNIEPKNLQVYSDMYIFGAIANGKVWCLESLTDFEYILEELPEDAVIIVGQNLTDAEGNNISNLLFLTKEEQLITDRYDVVKLESQAAGTILFEGNIEEEIILNGVDLTHDFVVESGGKTYSTVRYTNGYLVIDLTIPSFIGAIVTQENNVVFSPLGDLEDIKIYSIGKNNNRVLQNEYFAEYTNKKWLLIDWPESVESIPTTIAGKNISAIEVYSTKKIYYDREIDVIFVPDFWDSWLHANIEVAPGISPEKILTSLANSSGYAMYVTLDLSALTNVVIPEEVLEKFTYSSYNLIYVNESVKANYQEYDFIKVK